MPTSATRTRAQTCVGWEGPCEHHGEYHGCVLRDTHSDHHVCRCGATHPNAMSSTLRDGSRIKRR